MNIQQGETGTRRDTFAKCDKIACADGHRRRTIVRGQRGLTTDDEHTLLLGHTRMAVKCAQAPLRVSMSAVSSAKDTRKQTHTCLE